MTIFSTEIFYKVSKLGIWEKASTSAIIDYDTIKFFYSSYYKCYFILSDRYRSSYSKDLISWNQFNGYYIYDKKNDRIHKLEFRENGSYIEVTLSKMVSVGVFDTAKIIERVPNDNYTTTGFTRAETLGNYCIFSYYINTCEDYWEDEGNKSYQRVVYTSDSNNWTLKSIYSANDSRYQQRCLGSSGNKYILLMETSNGYCPAVFTSPTNFTIYSPIFRYGSLTSGRGFYINGKWHYADWGFGTAYNSSNGINFTSEENEWLNCETVYCNNKYISRSQYGTSLRCYNTDFSSYKEIAMPFGNIKYVLGILNNELYVADKSHILYKTHVNNITN